MKKPSGPVLALAIIGLAGLSLIKSSEGLRLSTYKDIAGIPTVCYGHTGPALRYGMTFTKAECELILLHDIRVHLEGVQRCVHVPLTQNQQDAVVSLTFNVGVSRFCKSTMARQLNLGRYDLAALEFTKWDKARVNGRLVKISGLTKRRTAEKALFMDPRVPTGPNALHGAVRVIWTDTLK